MNMHLDCGKCGATPAPFYFKSSPSPDWPHWEEERVRIECSCGAMSMHFASLSMAWADWDEMQKDERDP
jgi:hypothetical protein